MNSGRKNPIIAAFLSIVLPGLGQFYNGQKNKTMIFYSLFFVLLVLFSIMGLQHYFFGMLVFIILLLALYLFNIGDAFYVALKPIKIVSKPVNKWYIVLILTFLAVDAYALTGNFSTNILGIKPFYIPSNSDSPTLEMGDYIIADLDYYKTKTPERSNFIIFEYHGSLRVKRIIAVGGDIIEAKNNRVYVNHKPIHEPYIHPSNNYTNDFEPIVIPENTFFVMGDNRPASLDSRHPQFGLVDKKVIKGKPLYIYWSKNNDRIGREIK